MNEQLLTPDPDAPLLVFNIGVLGCMPLGTMEDLADEYGMTLYSGDQIRQRIMDKGPRGSKSLKVRDVTGNRVWRSAQSHVELDLMNGRDVVLDMNHVGRRVRASRVELAQKTGALTIALHTIVPPELAVERLTDWTKRDAFLIPIARWGMLPLKMAESIAGDIIPPGSDEGIDYIFPIDGSVQSSQAIIDQFDAALVAANLADSPQA